MRTTEIYKTRGCITYALINGGTAAIFAKIGVEFTKNFVNSSINPLEFYLFVLAGNITTTAITIILLHFIKSRSGSP